MDDGTQSRNDERTPLLGAGAGGTTTGGANGNTAGEYDEFAHLNRQAKSWKRRRWISLIASLFLIAGFVVLLVLSGSKSPESVCPTQEEASPHRDCLGTYRKCDPRRRGQEMSQCHFRGARWESSSADLRMYYFTSLPRTNTS